MCKDSHTHKHAHILCKDVFGINCFSPDMMGLVVYFGPTVGIVGGKVVTLWQTPLTQNLGAVHGDDVVVLMELRVGDEEFEMHV